MTESDVEIVVLPDNAKLDALARGQVDLAHLGEPWVARSRARGMVVWRSGEQVSTGLDMAYIVFSSRLLEEDRELGVRFLAGYLEGVADYLGGKTEENVAIVARETGLEPDLIREACWPAVRADGSVDLETLRLVGAWAVERGLLERAPDPELLVDRELLAEARLRLAGPDR
jgi:ABC-type nitrate/sulfonate/bicarbonate transport system substrate-binding protein